MKLVRIELLNPIEDFSQKRVNNMKEKMVNSCIWQSPICIEKNYYLILDGHHRYNVAKILGFKYIPCESFDYKDKDVLVWSLRDEYLVTKKLVKNRSLNGDIYPYKTAKHKFPYKIEKCLIPLLDLSKYNKFNSDFVDYKVKGDI